GDAGAEMLFEDEDGGIHDFAGTKPHSRFRKKTGEGAEIECDFIGGCDGSHGVCRPSIPEGALRSFEREYPFGWLGILSESPPPCEELLYAYHQRAFRPHPLPSPPPSPPSLPSPP